MMGTFECVYETPCHWCSKWDKKCDRKIGLDKCDKHKWFSPSERMPEIGAHIIMKDWDGTKMESECTSHPTDLRETNVMKWRYVND